MVISVIIPSYNSEKTIKSCLEALQSQSLKDIEITVIDDGSTDKTDSIVKSFKNVKFFKRQHKGPASARNFGAKMARGKILLFTDSDCEPDKNWIAEMVAPFSDKSIAGVSGTYRTRQKEIIAKFAQYEIEERHEKMAMMASIDFIGTFSAGYRKEIFDNFGGFDESFSTSAGEDPELSFRISEAGHKMVFAPKAFVYHQHPDTLWKYLRQKYRNAYWRVFVYGKRKKTVLRGHSYTPNAVLGEALCAFLFVLLFVLTRIFSFPDGTFMFGLSFVNLLLILLFIYTFFPSIITLTKYILNRDTVVAIWSPLIIFLRTFATAFGIIRGLLKRYII